MLRVDCEGIVLALEGQGLMDLLFDLVSNMPDSYIVKTPKGYVVDSIRGEHAAVLLVSPMSDDEYAEYLADETMTYACLAGREVKA